MSDYKAIPEVSLDTQTLERLLLTVEIGTTIPYAQLSAAIGRNVQTVARHHMTSARRRVLREPHRMLFEAVAGVGLKRLDDAGKIATGHAHIRKSRRQAKFASTKTQTVEHFDTLPNHLKVEHNLVLAQAGVLQHVTSQATARKVEQSLLQSNEPLKLKESLAAMKGLL